MPISRSTRITILLVIDFFFFLVELIVGYAVGSLALVADSFHMLNDIMSLVVALYAIKLTAADSHKERDSRYSYGWHRAEILAALVNGVFLLALCFSIFMEAMERFFSTPEVSNPRLVVIVGSLGLASNFVGLFLFHEHGHSHGHGHGDSADEDHDHPHEHAVDASESSSGTATPIGEARGEVDHEEPYYGHPIATRAAVVHAAHELELARSPTATRESPFTPSTPSTPHRTRSYSVPRTSIISDDEHTRVGSQVSESTPLLNDHKLSPSKQADIDVHDAADDHDHSSGSSSPKKRKPKKRPHGQGGSMNMRALVLHVLGDALGNVGVIATGLVIWLTSWSWKYYFDPMVSLVITVIIFSSALPLVKSASFILLQGVPSGISLEEVDEAIRAVPGVRGVHELHIWQLSESKVVASVHVLASRKVDFMEVAAEIRSTLHDHGIHSTTIQPEYHSSRRHNSVSIDAGVSCLLPCPPNQQDCNPAEHACCPPPPAQV